MTEIYTAPTNGHEIRSTDAGGLRINLPGMDHAEGHEPQILVSGRVKSLREYFRDERDRELGRWRSSADPIFVGYKARPGKVKLVNEVTGDHEFYSRRQAGQFSQSEFDAIAEEYFDAHPEPKPWHDAKQNDVWALQIKGSSLGPELYRFAQDTTCADSKVFRPVNNPDRVFFEARSSLIESAEKVWPRGKES